MTDVVLLLFSRITPVMDVLSVDWDFPFPLTRTALLNSLIGIRFRNPFPNFSDSHYEISSISELLLPSANSWSRWSP